MGTFTVDADVHVSGPLFDGVADDVVQRVLHEAAKDLADIGRDWIRIEAQGMDRSGRGGTGRAAAGVQISDDPPGYKITGATVEGEVWWPWLEGVSKRNTTTRFRGYHTFRKNAARLDRVATDILEKHLAEHMAELGGA